MGRGEAHDLRQDLLRVAPSFAEHPPADTTAAVNGAAALAGLCWEQGQRFPFDTLTTRTPSGGFHLYFTAPSEK